MLLVLRTLVGVAMQLVFFAALMLGPIGTTDWPAAIVWLQVYALLVFGSAAYLLITRPAAIEARMRVGREAQTPKDRLALSLMIMSMMVPVVIASLDVFYWQLLMPVSPLMQAVGMAVFLVGFVFSVLSMLHNEFAAPTVHIQEDAGHYLAGEGIYAYLRHPMYSGFLFFFAGMTLWLGSYAATLLAVVCLILSTIYRIGIEEEVLKKDLPGYSDYMQKVKTRFLPFIY